jgi:hypothetical protein
MASVSPLRQAGGQGFVKAEHLRKIIVTDLIYSVAATGNVWNQAMF